MAHLIIGHTTETTARVWVRGDEPNRACKVVIQPTADGKAQTIDLGAGTDYTGIVDFTELKADTEYTVTATFFGVFGDQMVRGRVRTLRNATDGQPLSFSFVLSSCNLSVVSISNFVALLIAKIGASAALSSLDLPLPRWKAPAAWLRPLAAPVLKKLLSLVSWSVIRATDVKQPGVPYLRSPFLKLSAVFDSKILDVRAARKPLPAAGDCVVSSSGATGVVACSPEVDEVAPSNRAAEDRASTYVACRVVLTEVEGTFNAGDTLLKKVHGNTAAEPVKIGEIIKAVDGDPWYQVPDFFIHAGDQIYYDFPVEARRPDRHEYRLAYREAWFEDDANRYLLSHWPNYMTLDDHEIADQFARDFCPAAHEEPDLYFREASVAYREYQYALSPVRPRTAARRTKGPYCYTFNKGSTRFFVLDTRTERVNDVPAPRMIGDAQMRFLLKWMKTFKDDLKFIVTSVPFVAQVNDTEIDAKLGWFDGGTKGRIRNPENDKWCAKPFERQRDQIIEYIAAHNIEKLVFLTGDMHCCYHASMRIGDGSKYESITVHELAGGPVNQLQLADAVEFHRQCSRRTSDGVAYEVSLDQFHGEVNAVLHLKVEYVRRDQLFETQQAFTPEVEWNVIRTLTDNGPSAWTEERGASDVRGYVGKKAIRKMEPVMAGRITFVRKRTTADLSSWPSGAHAPALNAAANAVETG